MTNRGCEPFFFSFYFDERYAYFGRRHRHPRLIAQWSAHGAAAGYGQPNL
jgi:hypothetical protein